MCGNKHGSGWQIECFISERDFSILKAYNFLICTQMINIYVLFQNQKLLQSNRKSLQTLHQCHIQKGNTISQLRNRLLYAEHDYDIPNFHEQFENCFNSLKGDYNIPSPIFFYFYQ
ncbi:hypothetical protein CR513_19796, partial [Mucuna pruriens]